MNSRTFSAVLAAVLALTLGACGSQSPAPTESPIAPTPTTQSPAPVPSTAGATVSGTVAVSSGPSTVRALTASSSSTSYTIVVSVAGTSLSTTADGVGRFKLTGVPSGTVQLKFSGEGMQGSVTLSGVKDADQIDVNVVLSPTGAAVETEGRDNGSEAQLEGRIAALKPGGAATTLLVDATTVDASKAEIRHGEALVDFDDLHVGDRVHVKGVKTGTTLAARLIALQNDNPNVPVNVSGSVTALQSGSTCPVIRFTVGGWTVETSAATSFQKAACSTIAVGTSVHVKGDVQPSTGRVLATWVQIGK